MASQKLKVGSTNNYELYYKFVYIFSQKTGEFKLGRLMFFFVFLFLCYVVISFYVAITGVWF